MYEMIALFFKLILILYVAWDKFVIIKFKIIFLPRLKYIIANLMQVNFLQKN